MIVRSIQGDTVDTVCWRYMGATAGVVEQTFAANSGLADLGVVLPTGTVIALPEAPGPSSTKKMVKLWD